MIISIDIEKYVKSSSFLNTERKAVERCKTTTVSVIVICKDEERCIKRCVDSVLHIASELIVIDTGSQDNTLTILSNYDDVKLFYLKWDDNFSKVRNFGLEKASGDWIFFIDADEWFLDSNKYFLELLIYLNTYILSDSSIFSPKIKCNEASTCWSNGRIFKKESGIRYRGRIHEEPILESGSPPLNVPIDIEIGHDGYDKSIIEIKDKGNRNMSLLKKSLAEEPNDVRWRYFFLRDRLLFEDEVYYDETKFEMMDLMIEILRSDKANLFYGYFREMYKIIMRILYFKREYKEMIRVSKFFYEYLNGVTDYFYYVMAAEIEIARDKFTNDISKILSISMEEREGIDTSDNYALNNEGLHIDELICTCLASLGVEDLSNRYRDNIIDNYPGRMIIS
ncbi:glycosyltransferase [Vibrio metschnikovii]|uniref:glycosyltransferase n=1 Tax=Vibrio metschnikovii TaxID=28172 RepID=UPI001644F787|nr:glycosyltransferase [Vibrio metschnikovii]MBC3620314.1 glycosyltransferase [Vibrio metschnikovii]